MGLCWHRSQSLPLGLDMALGLSPPYLTKPDLLSLGLEEAHSILLGMTYPFNSQVRPCLSLILCVYGFPSYLAYNPRFLPCPDPGYFSVLCSHLASFLKTPNGFSLKAFAFTIPFLRFYSSRYTQGLPPPHSGSAQSHSLGDTFHDHLIKGRSPSFAPTYLAVYTSITLI